MANVYGDLLISRDLTARKLISNIASGTAPLTVSSTTLVTNLNSDLFDGQHGSYYLDPANLSGSVGISKGGTNLSSIGSSNQILGVNSGASALEYKTITAGSGITITPASGSITISSTAASTVNSRDAFNGNNSTTDFTLSNAVSSANLISVFVEGIIQIPTDNYILPDSTTLRFTTAPSTGTKNIIVVYSGVAPTPLIIQNGGSTLTTSVAQINFAGMGYTATNSGNNVTLTMNTIDQYALNTFTGNGATTTFSLTGLSQTTNAKGVLVILSGVLQEPTTDYSINGSNQVVFVTAPGNGTKIVVRVLGKVIDLGIPSNNTVDTAQLSTSLLNTINGKVSLTSTETITGNKTFSLPINILQTTGTAPLTVSSTTLVNNLNVDMLDGQHGSYYATDTLVTHLSGTETITGNKTFNSTITLANATTGINAAGNIIDQPSLRSFRMERIDKGTVSSGTVTFDISGGNQQRLQVGGALTIAFSNWATTGKFCEVLLEIINGGAFTITWPSSPVINFIKSDGTTQTTPTRTLQTTGTDWVVVWSRDAGTTLYGKII